MCICHPFHHWMNIRRARIIVFSMGVCIFIIGGIVAAHHKTTKVVSFSYFKNVTISTTQPAAAWRGGQGEREDEAGVALDPNSTFSQSSGSALEKSNTETPHERTDLVYYTFPVPSVTKTEERPAVESARVDTKCQVDVGTIHDDFFKYFHKMYISIFILSCIIVLVLYSLIYRSVIAQRKKKLRIKSAQCCLLWNATSVEAPPPEALEMTQDIELSHVNGGEDRFAARQHSGAGATAEELEAAIIDSGAAASAPAHNNGASATSAIRKSSLSNARIERMRVANIKTAGTLFVVTIVFIIAFLPAWLMASNVLHMNVIVFYMYFIYNVVNPFIYAFLNQNFKTELKRIFHCRAH
ncbi:orexin receptor type 1 [Elysia marginata]|uniref:Orexin receptor type 1 n=1 Tax=Elysia marginata TaxID=1093978 RepID=A0AAV4F3I6_9GAST|nr:orexin receptor type 1 [Elysia marginata]